MFGLLEHAQPDYLNVLFSGVSRTYNKHLQALKLIFKTVLPDNSPFAELKAKLLEQESRKAFSREQINAIFAKLDDPEFYLLYKDEMRIVLMLELIFGLRLHDAVCFQWSYIKGNVVICFIFLSKQNIVL